MKIKQIENGKRYKKEAVFLLIYTGDFKSDKKYMLMQMRTDGGLGFPGGMVDKGEYLTEALNRELKEEINVENLVHPNSIPFCSHLIKKNGKKMATHLFELKVNESRLKEIIASATEATDFLVENRGNVIMTLDESSDEYNKNLLESKLASSVKEELELVIEYFGN